MPLPTPPRTVITTRTLNLGVLAHVDAGKTSLTERLLFDHGTIPRLGSVDSGDTQTDSGELERRRGITIRSAVAWFRLGDLQVNLVDTPGHPDFVAEVDRALSVLDGAVLVISAVEGVQAQTGVLLRSLRRLRLPTLLFVNKIDRMGARHDDLLAEIRRRLTPAVLPMVRVERLGARDARVVARPAADGAFRAEAAELLADHDLPLLGRVIDGDVPEDVSAPLRDQTCRGLVHPVYFGSAVSGAGTAELADGIRGFLAPRPAPSDDLRGAVFAVERTGKGEKVAYLRLFSGTLHGRQRVAFRRRDPSGAVEEHRGRVAGLEVVGGGAGPLTAGDIGKLRGLPHVRVGDRLGADDDGGRTHFSPPILESVVRPGEPGRAAELHAALTRLADEDPLIRTRAAGGGTTSVLLYGAVQREVIAERLHREFGVEAVFEQARPVYFERPVGRGESVHEFDPRGPNDFWQTVGVRVEPLPPGSGRTFTRQAQLGLLPKAYHRAIEEAATATLRQGLHGWEVTDCAVTITRVGFDAPMTVAADFRHLTPVVLLRALRQAGSAVHEPGSTVEVEVPDDALSAVTGLLLSLGADLGPAVATGPVWRVPGDLPARSLHDLAAALPGLTCGEGSIRHEPGPARRVRGPAPTRARTDGNPLDLDEYLRFLSNRDLADR
ncbi:TetM/TetW/TetO/TetS family tetracycline resistance ribosomal protection protein [Saccharothrix sp. 6-C]|uniref:elongation factor G n=1 Tax=Saccharothrix sp. 6-C TaxID=2781735 RepID=UPI0019174C50|nr:TetM/TetW/TetO/TetS family tetracycline resistance ribosomal protection protein [Saccharothrix sp. 6-C]QQQ74329.1 TetM/TetW/TetO/TetS family tetracycline resistance ribosomal protection protein [Saccharothrix sp. 6-C]